MQTLWWACAREDLWSLNIISSPAVHLCLSYCSLIYLRLQGLVFSLLFCHSWCQLNILSLLVSSLHGSLSVLVAFWNDHPLYGPEWLPEASRGSRDLLEIWISSGFIISLTLLPVIFFCFFSPLFSTSLRIKGKMSHLLLQMALVE